MTFLAPLALGFAVLAALGTVLLHLVARQRPAAFLLPTARFIPDRRTLVSRVTNRPRDLWLLLLRVLLLMAAGAAFARPVLTPRRGTSADIVLLDRSRAVADTADANARARAVVHGDASSTIVPVDGSISAALVSARRAATSIARGVDSVHLVLVSPVAASELDSATSIARAAWPGALRLERVALRADSSSGWRIERPLALEDPLGPALASQPSSRGQSTRLVRGTFSVSDSAFARSGGTVVRWDTTAGTRPSANGLLANGEVIVASLARSPLSLGGKAIAHWGDGEPAAVEKALGIGCMRQVGVALPAGGDLPLHPPFQRIVRSLLAPCGATIERAADSASVAKLIGATRSSAAAKDLRAESDAWSSLARWLLALALALGIAELLIRRNAVIPSEPFDSAQGKLRESSGRPLQRAVHMGTP
jgi:hypothetical protein